MSFTTLWHEHDDGFVGTHEHATDDNPTPFEHTHTADGAVGTAGGARWKRPKAVGDGIVVDLVVQSSQSGSASSNAG